MFEHFAEWCAEQLDELDTASLSVAVAAEGEIVYADAFGLADIAAGRPSGIDTPYLLASITKPMTATAVCVLAERGLITLDDPAEDYLDGARFNRSGSQKVPTIRHLLRHTAGLDTYYDFFYADGPQPERRGFVDTMSRYGTLFAEPAARYRYSNLGYGILDEVIRTASGSAPEDFIRTEVFLPLGMSSAHVGASYPGDAAPAERYAANGEKYPIYDSSHRGASMAWMTASDLVTFGLTQAGGRSVLSEELLAQMLMPVDGSSYGMGWRVEQVGELRLVGHTGGMGGVSTVLSVIPERHVSIAVLNNRSDKEELTRHALDRLLGELALDCPSTLEVPEARSDPAKIAVGDWAGTVCTYVGDVPLSLRVESADSISVTLGDGHRIKATLDPSRGPADLVVYVPAQLPTPDAEIQSPHLRLELTRHGNQLDGVAAAVPHSAEEAHRRLGNRYPHRCTLSQS